MWKNKIIVGVIAVVVAGILFSLPRVVIDNEGRNNNLETRQGRSDEAADAETEPAHQLDIPEETQATLTRLRENLESSENPEKSVIFADSLVAAYEKIGQYENAAQYAGQLVKLSPTSEHLRKAGDLYYEAFTFAVDADRAKSLGEQVRQYYGQVLEAQPDDLEAKTKMGMTYLATDNPMQGIQMLREVVAEDENNELAIYNLGLLSMQSGQYDKAIDRLEKVVTLNPDNMQAQFFLGVSYFEAKKKKKAREQFERIKTMSSDPEILANADNYLDQL